MAWCSNVKTPLILINSLCRKEGSLAENSSGKFFFIDFTAASFELILHTIKCALIFHKTTDYSHHTNKTQSDKTVKVKETDVVWVRNHGTHLDNISSVWCWHKVEWHFMFLGKPKTLLCHIIVHWSAERQIYQQLIPVIIFKFSVQ